MKICAPWFGMDIIGNPDHFGYMGQQFDDFISIATETSLQVSLRVSDSNNRDSDPDLATILACLGTSSEMMILKSGKEFQYTFRKNINMVCFF